MTDKVIKFGKARKAIARKTKEIKAAENRVKFGRTKAEKKRDENTAQKFKKSVDDHKQDKT